MGLFARASSLASPGKSVGGLLRRSLAAVGGQAVSRAEPQAAEAGASGSHPPAPQEPAGAPPPSLPAVCAEELTYRIAAIPAGFAAPLQLFALLRDVLGLQQAALLAYDPRRHVYSPLAAIGFDATSRHRLRLEPGANAEFNLAATGNIVQVHEDELAAFRPYFSSRQFAAVRQLALVPYLHNQRLAGLLLATRLARPLTAETLDLLRAGLAPGGELLAQNEQGEPEEDGRTPTERLQAVLADCGSRGQALLLIRLSLEELLRLAQERFPELERFRLYEFLVGYCRRLLRGIGLVEITRPPALVLLVHGMKDVDPPLLLRQLESALLAEVRGLVDARSVDLRSEVLTVTDDLQRAQEFLRS
jgi:hypothetical protein